MRRECDLVCGGAAVLTVRTLQRNAGGHFCDAFHETEATKVPNKVINCIHAEAKVAWRYHNCVCTWQTQNACSITPLLYNNDQH